LGAQYQDFHPSTLMGMGDTLHLRPALRARIAQPRVRIAAPNLAPNISDSGSVLTGLAFGNGLGRADDYSPYCLSLPADARLPGGGGNPLCGLFDLKPDKCGLPANNVITPSSQLGSQTEVWLVAGVQEQALQPGRSEA
jgi:hypothetical protein